MPLSFWEYTRLGNPQWRGQAGLAKRSIWFVLGTPDMHTRIRNAHVCNLVERLELPRNARVLDTGSGRAVTLFYLAHKHPDWRFTGLELDDEMIEPSQRAAAAGHYGNLKFIKTTVSALSDEDVYDLVLCMETLEHVPDDVGLLRQIHRALKPGGYLIVTTPRLRQEQWRWLPFFANHDVRGEFGHVRDGYREGEITQRIETADFTLREFHQVVGKRGEIAFELNNLFWQVAPLRRVMATLTYPLTVPIGFGDTRGYQKFGNTFLLLAQRP